MSDALKKIEEQAENLRRLGVRHVDSTVFDELVVCYLELARALDACRIKRRRDRPGWDHSLADGDAQDELARDFIRRAEALVERVLAEVAGGEDD